MAGEKGIKICLIDDEIDFTSMMAFYFKSKGYDVVVASSGVNGVGLIKSESPDIVFLDLNMPGMDGTDTLRKIREFTRDLPVIIISAYVEDRLRIREVNALGVAGVFYKGKDFDEGLNLLETALRTHKRLKK